MMLFHSKYAFAIPVNSGQFRCMYIPCSMLQHKVDRGDLKIHLELLFIL